MTKTEALKLIDRAFYALPDMQRGLREEKDRLYRMNLDSEARHRQGAPYGLKHGITKKIAARLFTVQHIADVLRGERRFEITDILSIRPECLYAQALADLFKKEITTAWKAAGVTLAALKEVDYAKLMDEGRA